MASDAGLMDALRAWAPMIASGYECPAAAQRMIEAADRIAALRSALEDALSAANENELSSAYFPRETIINVLAA